MAVSLLDDVVVDQIAAGEVVERPASVVKELVENSIDAEARDITVLIDNGGQSRIEVIDDGIGMSRDDAALSVERFATSKISAAEDLLSIASLGFRGEALSSIASVSRFRLRTREKVAKTGGFEVLIAGGRDKQFRDRSLPAGTSILVEQLFYNVPARRRFLKSERSETSAVKALLQDIALAHPELRFKLIADGKEVFHLLPAKDVFERARQFKIAGGSSFQIEQKFERPEGSYVFRALLSEPVAAVRGSASLRLIVNGRSVRDRLLLRAIREGYGNFLKGGQYPRGMAQLELPPSELDVNVHPQKSEVRFRESSRIFGMVAGSVRRHWETASAVDSFEQALRVEPAAISWHQGVVQSKPEVTWPSLREEESPAITDASSTESLIGDRYVGQIFRCYLIFENAQRMLMLDMHAAHERLVFARLKESWESGKVASQALLVPETISVPQGMMERCRELKEQLEKLGIVYDEFGEDCIVVRALPAVLGPVSATKLFDQWFSLSEFSQWSEMLLDNFDAVLSRVACHASVRSGERLEAAEAYALLRDVRDLESSKFCPHGRPVLREFRKEDVESMFGRS